MLEFLVSSVVKESDKYLKKWALGWKSDHLKPHYPKTLATNTSAATSSASSLSFPFSSSLLQPDALGCGLVQMSDEVADEGSDGSWETDDDDADSHHVIVDDELEQRRQQHDLALEFAGTKRNVHLARPPRSTASAPQDWEACEHRCFTPPSPHLKTFKF